MRLPGLGLPVFTKTSCNFHALRKKLYTWVGKRVRKTAGKKDDYTRLQHLNSLFMVIGSVSTAEETMQLQCTLSFMRQNDEGGVMSAKSFEHCIDQVVRFHFPNKRNLQYAHWNARKSTLDPLWVRASALSFVESVDRSSMRGLLLVSDFVNPRAEARKDGRLNVSRSILKRGILSKT